MFHVFITYSFRFMKEAPVEDWDQVPLSKMAFRAFFSLCSLVHFASFWNVQSNMSTKFHAGTILCMIIVITDYRTRNQNDCQLC